jgi:hypothetical protein
MAKFKAPYFIKIGGVADRTLSTKRAAVAYAKRTAKAHPRAGITVTHQSDYVTFTTIWERPSARARARGGK